MRTDPRTAVITMRPDAISRSTVLLDTESSSAASLMVLSMGSGFTSLEQTIDGGSEMDPFIGIDPDYRRRSSDWDLLDLQIFSSSIVDQTDFRQIAVR